MRIQQEPVEEKIVAMFVSLGIAEDVAELSLTYLMDNQKEEIPEELMEKLPKKQNFAKLTEEQKNKCYEAFQKISSDKILTRKTIHLLYEMGGATAKYPFKGRHLYMTYRAHMQELLELDLKREELLNISAELVVFGNSSYNWDLVTQWIETTKVSPEEIPSLLENCSADASNGKIFLLNVYFYLKEQTAGYHPKENDPELFKKLEHLVLLNMETIFRVTLTDEENKELYDYFEHGDQDIPLSEVVIKALIRGNMNSYLVKLLVGTAFLHYKFSKKLENFVRIETLIEYQKYQKALSEMVTAVPKNYWKMEKIKFDQIFPIPKEYYLEWLAKSGETNVLKMKAKKDEPLFIRTIESNLKRKDFATAATLWKVLKEENDLAGESFETLFTQMKKELRDKIIETTCENRQSAIDVITDYLKGVQPLPALLKEENQLQKEGRSYSYYIWNPILSSYVAIVGEDEFYERILVLMSISQDSNYYNYIDRWLQQDWKKENSSVPYLDKLFSIFQRQEVPIYYFIKVVESYENYYYSDFLKVLKKEAIKRLAEYEKDHREELIEVIKKLKAFGRVLVMEGLLQADEANSFVLIDHFSDTSKQVKAALVTMLKDRKEVREQIIEKLSSKKATERETAMQILCEHKTDPEYRQLLENALKTEKSEKLAAYLKNQLYGITEQKEEKTPETAEEYAKELLKGNRKRSLAWLYETPMPAVHNQKKEEMPVEYMQAVLLSYSTLEPAGINLKTELLTNNLDQKELELFAQAVFDRWLEKNAESKKKWVLYFASAYGGTDMIAKLKYQISEWPKNSRGAIAVDAVRALACNGSSAALMIVDGFSRKFKYRQIKNAAAEALRLAAKALEVSSEELLDRIVPDLGFSEDGSRTFCYGPRSFQVFLTPALELEIFDEKKKKLKTLPSPNTKDDPEQAKQAYQEFKAMKKLLKTTIASQQSRLEFALSNERKWSVTAWENLFVKNPIMHQFAIGLIWGVYQDDILKDTFRYMEDGTFNNVEEEEYELLKDAKIGLVHPLELSEELIEAWKEQLSDYEIVQPVVQLERKVYKVKPEEEDKKELERFGGYIVNHLSLAGKLMENNWERGSILDAGCYYTFDKVGKEENVGAELEFSGAYVGGDNEDVTLYQIRFYRLGIKQRHWNGYDTIPPQDALCLKEVPKRFFSETIYELTKILSGSSRKDPDWKKKYKNGD